MMPERSEFMDRGPTAAVALEGNYVNYVFVNSVVIAGAFDWYNPSIDNNGLLLVGNNAWPVTLAFVTLAGVTTNIVNRTNWDQTTEWDWRTRTQSLLRTYRLAQDTLIWRVAECYKNGALIWTRDVALDDANVNLFESYAISPDGHYIVIIGHSTLTGLLERRMIYAGV